jgi:serine palmitoyltransferase
MFSGNQLIHHQLETAMADYLGVEATLCFPMGFATNTMGIPSIVDKVGLIFFSYFIKFKNVLFF